MFVYTSPLAFLEKSSGQPDTPHQSFLVLLPWSYTVTPAYNCYRYNKECA